MTPETYDPKLEISLTESAVKHIEKALQKESKMTGIKLYLETSGCSGFMYETKLCESAEENERTFEITEKLKLFVPNKDLPMLNGTTIDFITVGLNSMFQFRNPNVTGECGCGESFSVTED